MRHWQGCVIFFSNHAVLSMARRAALELLKGLSSLFVLDGFLSFLLGFKETSWVLFSLGLKKPVEFLNSYTLQWHLTFLPLWREDAAGAGQSCCHGVPVCTASCSSSSLKSPQKYFFAFPSPLAEVGAAGTGRSSQQGQSLCVEWWRPQILITCPSPGVNHWPSGLRAGARKLQISSLQSSLSPLSQPYLSKSLLTAS